MLIGPLLETFARRCLEEAQKMQVAPNTPVIESASPLRGGCVLRLAGNGVGEIGIALQKHLHFVRGLLADDPWARKW